MQQGAASEIIDVYLRSFEHSGAIEWQGSAGNEGVRVRQASVLRDEMSTLTTDKPVIIKLELEVLEPQYGLIVAWEIWNQREQLLAYSVADDSQPPPGATTVPGLYSWSMEIPGDTFAAGKYVACLDLGIHNNRRLVPEKSICLELKIENTAGIGRRYPSEWVNILRPAWRWTGKLNS